MTAKHFNEIMNCLDDDLLEQAQMPPVRKNHRLVYLVSASAACLCLILLAMHLIPYHYRAAVPDISDITAMGYYLPVPQDSENILYDIVSLQDGRCIAQVEFSYAKNDYIYRCVSANGTEEFSLLAETGSADLEWSVGDLCLQLSYDENGNTMLGWYCPSEDIQWCLIGPENTAPLFDTALLILNTLGYELAVCPSGAQNVSYNVCRIGELTVGETVFSLGGVNYSFRMASSPDSFGSFPDISGLDGSFSILLEDSVVWCPAVLSYNEGGEGKIIWFDVVPGMVYSLSMDSSASRTALMSAALALFEPAQGDS